MLVNLAVLMVGGRSLSRSDRRSKEGVNEFLTVYGSRLINAAAKVRSSLG
jgi:hypothetical protein